MLLRVSNLYGKDRKHKWSTRQRHFQDMPIKATIVSLAWFAFNPLQQDSIFHGRWFPSPFEASLFMLLFCEWVLNELINSLWGRKNSQNKNQDKGSYRIFILTSWAIIIIIFMFLSFELGYLVVICRYRAYFVCIRHCASRVVDLGSWKAFYCKVRLNTKPL